MTKQEAIEWVNSHSDEHNSDDECEDIFTALFERPADARDREEGLWSHCVAAIDDSDPLVCGHQVQHDASGQGHAWRNIDAADIPANVILELEGHMIDGGLDTAEIVASNGQHYRW